MKNKLNPVAIGMFVLAAVTISVVAVMVFGASKFFADTEKYVSFFTESVNGLDVGAHVKYKGVVIGKVEEITIRPSADLNETTVAIFYSIDLGLVRRKILDTDVDIFDEWLEKQIADGLRAKLNYQSIVTGMLYIELDYLAEKGEKYHTIYAGTSLTEIPSAKSGLSEMGKAVEKTIAGISEINFAKIGSDLEHLLEEANRKISQLDVESMNDSALETLESIREVAENPDLKSSLKNLDKLLVNADDSVASIRRDFSSVTQSAAHTLNKVDVLLANLNSMFSPQSPFRYELSILLRNLSESLSSISNLSDYLQRNPSSLITGKSERAKTAK